MTKENCHEYSWEKVLDKKIPDIEVVQKIWTERKIEETRHEKEKESISEKLKGKCTATILYLMWEIITNTKHNEDSEILIPVDKDGNLEEYTCGHYLDYNTMQFSENGCYVSIKTSWNYMYVFPIEIFNYPDNFKKMKTIYMKFLKRRALAEIPKKIEEVKRDIKAYNTYIKRCNNILKGLNKQLSKLQCDATLNPLKVEELGFEDSSEKNEE